MRCDICNEELKVQVNGWRYGHNAEPVVMNGRCCDVCNSIYVIPTRLSLIQREGERDEK